VTTIEPTFRQRGDAVTEATGGAQDYETPTLAELGDLDTLTTAGANGSEDGNGGFTSV
jgi:hypothetical protein